MSFSEYGFVNKKNLLNHPHSSKAPQLQQEIRKLEVPITYYELKFEACIVRVRVVEGAVIF